MFMTRRRTLAGVAATALTMNAAQAMMGTKQAPKADQDAARAILSRLPRTGYVAIMQALADLDKTEKWSTHNEPFNRRWQEYANPLLVDIWNEMGYGYTNDCQPWCGITLGWCLKRAGYPVPKDCASSQVYLNYGTRTLNPVRGDICVFTNQNDKSHGHVTIYWDKVDDKNIRALGANQELSEGTNCPTGGTANVVDLRVMALSTTGHHLNRYVRPPARA